MDSGAPSSTRIDWIDTAKAYGMFLVYYGHFVERVSDLGNPLALVQQKLIYSFHMPLFILLSGLVAKTELPGLGPFLKKQAASRLVPVLFFSVLVMPIEPLVDALLPHSGFRPTQIGTRWIHDWPEVCQRLEPPHQEAEFGARARLWELLPAEVRETVAAGAGGRELDDGEKEGIAAALDTLLTRADLFTPEDFAGAETPERVAEALGEDPAELAGDDLRAHNWVLTWWSVRPDSRFWRGQDSYWLEWLGRALMTLKGYPMFNWLTWFLICLFSVELIHFVSIRWLKTVGRMGLAIPLFFGAGLLVTAGIEWQEDIWFIRESVLLYSFYLLGLLLRRSGALERLAGLGARLLLFVASSAVLLLTFQLNPGADFKPVVLVNLSQHGDPIYFAITAVAGCLAVIGLARLTPRWGLVQATGRHTLIFLGLNEFYFSSLNRVIARFLEIPPSTPHILFWCTLVTVASMVTCVPLIRLFDRYVPQLVGRPREKGPLLPNLV